MTATPVPAHESGLSPEALPTNLPRIGSLAVAMLMLLVLAVLGGLFLLGYYPHRRLKEQVLADAAEARDALPMVNVVSPRRQVAAVDLRLPVDIQPYQSTSIFPRANGYLKKLHVDLGDRVRAGQLLAEIDTPEVDAQLNQARAMVEQAQGSLQKAEMDFSLAQSTLQRYESVLAGGVAQQEIDEKKTQFNQAQASLSVARAALTSAKAQVQQLEVTQSFEKVNAPFDGVISARNQDLGALLSPGNASPGKELFRLDRADVLRAFARVPQAYAELARVGLPVTLTVRNFPGRKFQATIARTAGSIEAATRTLRVQVDVPNPDGVLFAGMYGQANMHVESDNPPLLVPTGAIIYDANGLSLSLVRDGRVHMQSVMAGRDLGTEMEILEGLEPTDVVITNPGEHVREGVAVQVRQPTSKAAQ